MDIIFVDIETTGACKTNSSIISIGAVSSYNSCEFYEKCRWWKESRLDEEAAKINGETVSPNEKVFDSSRELVYPFVTWCLKNSTRPILAGWNLPSFDAMFLHKAYAGNFNMTWPLGYRFIDIHSIAYFMFGESFNSGDLARKLEIPLEENPHNALNGARQARNLYTALKAKNPFNNI